MQETISLRETLQKPIQGFSTPKYPFRGSEILNSHNPRHYPMYPDTKLQETIISEARREFKVRILDRILKISIFQLVAIRQLKVNFSNLKVISIAQLI